MPYLYDDEDNAPMNDDVMPEGMNCHDRCRYSKICTEEFHCKGSNDKKYPFECAIYDKIDDIMMDTEDIPFYDPNDPPEEETDD